jgi:prolyl 4-hydroxylase
VTQSPLISATSLIDAGRASEAIGLLSAAGDKGDVDALFMLATHYLAGETVVRDLRIARALLRRAIKIGHVDAALMEIALNANGSGGLADWRGSLSQLRTAAVNDPVAADHARLLGSMTIEPDGFPRSVPLGEPVSDCPRVLHFPSFLTEQECAHLAQTAAPFLVPSTVVDPVSHRLIRHPVRTCDAAVIGPAREDLVVGAINRRIAAISGTDWRQGEPLTILRYAPGGEYRPHLDALPGAANQRIRTVIIFLNQGFTGGETYFAASDTKIMPKAGDAIMFDNCLIDGAPDPQSRHAGLPVKAGAKWIATRWIRNLPLDPWNFEK